MGRKLGGGKIWSSVWRWGNPYALDADRLIDLAILVMSYLGEQVCW